MQRILYPKLLKCAKLLSMDNLYNNLVIISSPSGGGKGTLIGMLMKEVNNVWLSVSATSRKPREGEKDGVEYYFLTRDEFKREIENDGFLEWAEYSGNFYGTPRKYVEEHLRAGDVVLLEIEVQGAQDVMEKCAGCHSVFIEPPSLQELERRLRGRGTETEEAIQLRLKTAEGELKAAQFYDKTIVNDNLKLAFCELKEYINSLAN